jgi:hypothetical protein
MLMRTGGDKVSVKIVGASGYIQAWVIISTILSIS